MTKKLIATSESGLTTKSAPSLRANIPAATVTSGWPAKVNALSVATSIDDPVVRCARCTLLMCSGPLPRAFEMRTRAALPPMLVCTIERTVCPVAAPHVPSGAAAHVPVQPFDAPPSVGLLVLEPSPASAAAPPSVPPPLAPLPASTTASLPLPPLLVPEPSFDPLPPIAPAAPALPTPEPSFDAPLPGDPVAPPLPVVPPVPTLLPEARLP